MNIIMYHYVRPNSDNYPFFKNLDLNNFIDQSTHFYKLQIHLIQILQNL